MNRGPTDRATFSTEEKRARLAQLLRDKASEPKTAPLSFAQQRLWFLEQMEGVLTAYNMPFAWRLRGELRTEALRRALDAVVRRHESLRTRFRSVAGRPVQIVAQEEPAAMEVVELDGDRGALERRVREEAHRRFDLSEGPCFRTTLFRLSDEEQVVLLSTHHIVSDGWSEGVLVRELGALYEAFLSGQPAQLPKLPIQYADYARWQREWLQGEVLESQLGYWKGQLANLPVLELPLDRPRPALERHRGARETLSLEAPLAEKLVELSRREGVTLFMTLLAAFQTLLHRYTGQPDVVVGLPIAGRNRSELEGLIGLFVNTLVLRGELSGNPSFREVLGRVRKVALEAYAHQDVPFEKLVEELRPERDLSRNPLFQVMFVLQNVPLEPLELKDVTSSPMDLNRRTAHLDLTLYMRETEQGLKATAEYNTDLFDRGTIERMLEHFAVLLESIVADPEQRISELALMTPAERSKLVVEWNDTRASFAEDLCLHELFEVQTQRTPDATAVGFEDEELSYGELNSRANRLAHHLAGMGVGQGVLVGLLVERSLEMVVGLLGVLKAGGAYVPLDPDVSGGAPGIHGRGCRDIGFADAGTPARGASSPSGACGLPGRRPGVDRQSERRQSTAAHHLRGPGLCDLHVGLDGSTEGGRDFAPCSGELLERDAQRAGVDGRGHVAFGDDAFLRHCRTGAVPAVGARCAGDRPVSGGGLGWRALAREAGVFGCHGDAGDAGDVADASGRRLGGHGRAQGPVRGRSPAAYARR